MTPDPLDPSTQTLPQQGPPVSLPIPTPIHQPAAPDPTATLAAPVNYDPSKIAASTRASTAEYQPISPADDSNLIGRYSIIKAHARGGMGQVSLAKDRELDREIAVKEIQPRFVSDSGTLARFILEARVTGQLQHPGIVPVYGMGARPDGRPFYAMKFISGQSLQDVIDEYHKAGRPALQLRQLLRRFIDVCNTIGYAHSRGFLHRDIKPANIMLGEFGETLVVDWGLAKEMAGKVAPLESGTMKPINPDDFEQTAAGFTLYGQTMGTPAYMSPEQAAGQWDVTGVASDVYSLGAIFYSILTGSAPYTGPTREVITKVQKGEYRPMKALNINVAKPLQAICQKALAFQISDRYSTALAFAADVERWLGDEPVSCYLEPWHVRLTRWARRHRTAVASTAALLLTGTVALAIGLVLVNKEREAKKQAFAKAAVARDEAREALLSLTDDVVGEILATSHKPTPQQIRFLDSLIGMYERFAKSDGDSPEMQLFVVNALTRVGQIQGRIGRVEPAEESFEKARAIVERHAKADEVDWLNATGELHLFHGILNLQHAKPEAESEFTFAVEAFEKLVARSPKPDYRFRLSQSLDRLGVWHLTRNDFAKALANGDKARAIRTALAEEFPTNPDYQFRVAQSDRQRAAASYGLGQQDQAKMYAEQAVTVLNSLVAASPTQAPYLALLGDLENQLATFTAGSALYEDPNRKLSDKADETEAMAHALKAVRTWGQLTTLHPGDATYRRKLAESQLTLAEQSCVAGNGRAAIAAIDTAMTVLLEMRSSDPGNRLTLFLLGQMHQNRALIYRARGNPKAGDVIADANRFLDELITTLPQDGAVRSMAAKARLEDVILRRDQGKADEAKAAFTLASAHIRDAATRGNADALRDWTSVRLRDFIADDKDWPAFAKAIRALPLAPSRLEYEVACLHGQLARLIDLERPEETKRVLDHLAFSLDALKKAVTAGWTDWELIRLDPYLAKLRETNEYQTLERDWTSRKRP